MLHRVMVIGAMLAVLAAVPSANAQESARGSLLNLQNTSPYADGQDASMSPAFGISGNVVTEDGSALPEAHIEIRDLTSGRVAATGYSSQDGSFSVSNIPRGSYEVVATIGIYETSQQLQVDGIDNSLTLRMPHVRRDVGAAPTVSVAQMQVPEKAVTELKKARKALEKEKLSEVEKHVSKALSIEPKYSDALTLRAILRLNAGDLKSATADLSNAISFDGNNGLAYIAMGSVYNSQERFDDAARELERGIALLPNFWQGYYELGRAQLGKGDFEKALRSSTRAEELSDRFYGPVHIVRGHALLALKNFEGAIGEFQKYLDRQKDGPVAAEVRQQLDVARANMTAEKR